MITCKINNQSLVTIYDEVVADSVEYLTANFTFSDDWNGYSKTVIFSNYSNNKVLVVTLIDGDSLYLGNNTCYVPHEVIESPGFSISVFGIKDESVITTDEKNIVVRESGYKRGETPEEPTPTDVERIIGIATSAKNIADSVRLDADNGVFNGNDGITPNISVSASVDSLVGTPSVIVRKGGTVDSPTFSFSFSRLRGEPWRTIIDMIYEEDGNDPYPELDIYGNPICCSKIRGYLYVPAHSSMSSSSANTYILLYLKDVGLCRFSLHTIQHKEYANCFYFEANTNNGNSPTYVIAGVRNPNSAAHVGSNLNINFGANPIMPISSVITKIYLQTNGDPGWPAGTHLYIEGIDAEWKK